MKFAWSKIKKPVFCLAPMANITTWPFRLICKQMGADIVFTPMVSSDAIIHNPKHAKKLAEFKKRELPCIIQVFGYDGEKILRAIKILDEALHPAGFDINMGCPATKITGNACGASLIQDPKRAIKIAKIVRDGFSGQLSIKTRLGWDKINILSILKEFEKIGIDAISIHGRTVKQGYSGLANWDAINEIADNLNIPVIGNGDIKDWKTAYNHLKNSKLSGVMIGQGAMGNPWIFKEIKKKKDFKVSKKELARIINLQAKNSIKYQGEEVGVKELRKHLAKYFSNFPNAIELRKQGVLVSSYKDVKHILKQI